MTLGARIYLLREKQGLTQKQLADKVGIAQKNFSAYEKDTVIPSSSVIKKIAEALGTDANYLLDVPAKNKMEHPFMALFRDIESMPEKERSSLLTMIQTFVNAYKKSKN